MSCWFFAITLFIHRAESACRVSHGSRLQVSAGLEVKKTARQEQRERQRLKAQTRLQLSSRVIQTKTR